jgi:hypothetical protein
MFDVPGGHACWVRHVTGNVLEIQNRHSRILAQHAAARSGIVFATR